MTVKFKIVDTRTGADVGTMLYDTQEGANDVVLELAACRGRLHWANVDYAVAPVKIDESLAETSILSSDDLYAGSSKPGEIIGLPTIKDDPDDATIVLAKAVSAEERLGETRARFEARMRILQAIASTPCDTPCDGMSAREFAEAYALLSD